MPKLVLLLGSGATRAQAPNGVTKSDQPPLDQNFFSQFKESNGSDSDLLEVENYIKDTYGYEITQTSLDSFEAVASIIYSDSYSSRTGASAYPVLLSLIQFLSARIAATVNPLRPDMSNALEQILNHAIFERGPDNVSIVTFNYDIQVERSLRDLSEQLIPKSDKVFRFPGCYRLRKYDVRTLVNSQPLLPKSSLSEASAGIPVLKLHGSLNWYSGYQSSTPAQRQFLSPSKTRRIRIGNIDHIPNWPIGVFTGNSRRLRGYPTLVPPVPNKSSLFHDEISRLWSLAFGELSTADEILVFGYSCPNADQEAANLIRSAAGLNSNLSRVSIIDPNPGVIARFADLTASKSISWHYEVDEFLQNSP